MYNNNKYIHIYTSYYVKIKDKDVNKSIGMWVCLKYAAEKDAVSLSPDNGKYPILISYIVLE